MNPTIPKIRSKEIYFPEIHTGLLEERQITPMLTKIPDYT